MNRWPVADDRLPTLDGPEELLRAFGFAIPDATALLLIAVHSAGVVEVGAGSGGWVRLLHERDVDAVAYDGPRPARASARRCADPFRGRRGAA